jgi:AbiV family abortive infection protein
MKETKTHPEYQTISRLAYDNGTELLEEARLLLREKESPRAFALAVASIEELTKAYLADSVWKQDLDPDALVAEFKGRKWKILTHHGSKQHLFALFLIMDAARQEGSEKMANVDKTLRETLMTDAIDVKGKNEIVELITSMEGKRQDSLYVGTKVEAGRIRTPKKEISRQMSEDLIGRIERFLPILETNLKLSKPKYQQELAKIHAETKRGNLQTANSLESTKV